MADGSELTGSAPEEANPFLHFTDADLAAALVRAVRLIGIFAVVLLPVAWFWAGWQSAALLLVGAVISAGGVWESRRLIAVVNARLDRRKSGRWTGLVVAVFLLRLAIAGGLLYVSLRFLDGSVYALLGGLMLAIVALSIEVIRLTQA